ncbi:hypothetical protein XENOCAPTIV_013681 [Xenoophorus captivus]|uniref:Uncharacterized protein n=1 Tax=Xenoophorus captivus TaxID=1517983 RepID=A0ABV0QLT4_9TELE
MFQQKGKDRVKVPCKGQFQGEKWLDLNCSGPQQLMEPVLYQKVPEKNVWPSLCNLQLQCTWIMQQDNEAHWKTHKMTQKSQSLDINFIKILWYELKQAIHA